MNPLLILTLLVGVFAETSHAQDQRIGDLDGATITAGESTYTEELAESENTSIANHLTLNYFGIFFGPSLQSPTSYQPDGYGIPDKDRPIVFRNFLNLGYNLTDELAVGGTFYWTWQPVLGHQGLVQDPFLKVSHNSIFRFGDLNLYGDLRVHFPASQWSRDNNMQFGVQSVQALTYSVGSTNLLLGLVASVRADSYGDRSFGNDMEFYLAPNVNYQITQTLAFTLLYEFFANKGEGLQSYGFRGYGSDIEPGLAWDATPQLTLNPYLHLPVSGSVSLNSTSFGMMINYALI